jgi:hypothetical protein
MSARCLLQTWCGSPNTLVSILTNHSQIGLLKSLTAGILRMKVPTSAERNTAEVPILAQIFGFRQDPGNSRSNGWNSNGLKSAWAHACCKTSFRGCSFYRVATTANLHIMPKGLLIARHQLLRPFQQLLKSDTTFRSTVWGSA